jgi:hypothetical protein
MIISLGFLNIPRTGKLEKLGVCSSTDLILTQIEKCNESLYLLNSRYLRRYVILAFIVLFVLSFPNVF